MKERYENLDGLRAFACIGIILMHVSANGKYGISGFVFDSIIPSFTNFTYLFMILSAFSMCCGYYESISSGSYDLEKFYLRRYQRIWPYFAFFCTLELITDHSLNSLYEWFVDITLVFGLIPNHKISVVGVGWFLGVVFVFYMVFPFFVFLLKNKRRAWITFLVCVIINVLCNLRFEDACERSNFIYSAMFFTAGGLLYLYRKNLTKKWIHVISVILLLGIIVAYYIINSSDYIVLCLFVLLSIILIPFGGGMIQVVFRNKAVRFLAGISMEMYLCHMFVFRAFEKCKLLHITNNEIVNFGITCVATICGAIVLSFVLKKVIEIVSRKCKKT